MLLQTKLNRISIEDSIATNLDKQEICNFITLFRVEAIQSKADFVFSCLSTVR